MRIRLDRKDRSSIQWRECKKAEQVTEDVLRLAESVFDNWYAEAKRINWEDFTNRMEEVPLANGEHVDLGINLASSAVIAIQKHIRAYRQRLVYS